MVSVEEARALILGDAAVLPAERVLLSESSGRVLAEDALSDVDVAPFDNTAMDGYALRAEDTSGATADAPVVLRVLEHIAAGMVPTQTITSGYASRIMTGAPIPEGADAVVMVERTAGLEAAGSAGGTVAVKQAVGRGENIRLRGEDIRAGAVVLSAGEVVGPAAVGLLAATGNPTVSVYRRPRVALLSTGDELVDATETPGPGQIRNSNRYAVAAQIVAAGGVPIEYGIVRDDRDAIRTAIQTAAASTDIVLSTGGASVGDFDFSADVLGDLGVVKYWKVDMRPGASQVYGTIGGVPYFGLSGNPTSAYVTFELFVRPALLRMQGFTALYRPSVKAVLAETISKKPGRRLFLRGRVSRLADARPDGVAYSVAQAGNQSSALLTTMHRANCLMVLQGEERSFAAGSVVDCIRLDLGERFV